MLLPNQTYICNNGVHAGSGIKCVYVNMQVIMHKTVQVTHVRHIPKNEEQLIQSNRVQSVFVFFIHMFIDFFFDFVIVIGKTYCRLGL
jgi:hypothetical protein